MKKTKLRTQVIYPLDRQNPAHEILTEDFDEVIAEIYHEDGSIGILLYPSSKNKWHDIGLIELLESIDHILMRMKDLETNQEK